MPWLYGFCILKTYAVVPNQRICHDDTLSLIGRVRKHLQVACHRCIEYNFADNFFPGAETFSFKHLPIFQNQKCVHESVSSLKMCIKKIYPKIKITNPSIDAQTQFNAICGIILDISLYKL